MLLVWGKTSRTPESRVSERLQKGHRRPKVEIGGGTRGVRGFEMDCGAVDMDRETVDVGNVFAGAKVINVGRETMEEGEVFADTVTGSPIALLWMVVS